MNDCWVKDTCKKYKNGNCNMNEFCIKKFKLETLYKNSLLAENQWYKVNLYLDKSRIDKDAFEILKTIENNIVEFVEGGSNLYIHSLTCGNGKTAWATRMIQAYLNEI